MQVQLLMASQFLPSIYICCFEWQLVPTHPPQNNISLISIAPVPSTFSSAEPILGKQALASRKEHGGEIDVLIEAINYRVANSTDACERKSIFPSPFFSDSVTPSAEKLQVSIHPVAHLLLSRLPLSVPLLSADFYHCQHLTLCIASTNTFPDSPAKTSDIRQQNSPGFPADLSFTNRIAHFTCLH